MKKMIVLAGLIAAPLFAGPAQAAECVSDLIKLRDFVQHAPLDRGTRRYADMMIGKAQIFKMDGKFEQCSSTVRELMHHLGIE